jgi:hypothetical protein
MLDLQKHNDNNFKIIENDIKYNTSILYRHQLGVLEPELDDEQVKIPKIQNNKPEFDEPFINIPGVPNENM